MVGGTACCCVSALAETGAETNTVGELGVLSLGHREGEFLNSFSSLDFLFNLLYNLFGVGEDCSLQSSSAVSRLIENITVNFTIVPRVRVINAVRVENSLVESPEPVVTQTVQSWQLQQVSEENVVTLPDTLDIGIVVIQFVTVRIALSGLSMAPLLLFLGCLVLPSLQFEAPGTCRAEVSPGPKGYPVSHTLAVSVIVFINISVQTLADRLTSLHLALLVRLLALTSTNVNRLISCLLLFCFRFLF